MLPQLFVVDDVWYERVKLSKDSYYVQRIYMNLHIRSLEETQHCFTSKEFTKFIIEFPNNADLSTYIIGEDGIGLYKQSIYKLPDEWHILCKVTAFYHSHLMQLKDKYKEFNMKSVKNDVMELLK